MANLNLSDSESDGEDFLAAFKKKQADKLSESKPKKESASKQNAEV